jgi:polyphosphate kinase 2 (PPK2 family)
MNPQGTSVFGFKQPSKLEASHDFLWRVHPQTPGKGEVVIFNRSHYEDVLVVRVHKLVPKSAWSGRYEVINDFEKMLV